MCPPLFIRAGQAGCFGAALGFKIEDKRKTRRFTAYGVESPATMVAPATPLTKGMGKVGVAVLLE